MAIAADTAELHVRRRVVRGEMAFGNDEIRVEGTRFSVAGAFGFGGMAEKRGLVKDGERISGLDGSKDGRWGIDRRKCYCAGRSSRSCVPLHN